MRENRNAAPRGEGPCRAPGERGARRRRRPDDRGARSAHRRFQRRPGDRGVRETRRHRQSRTTLVTPESDKATMECRHRSAASSRACECRSASASAKARRLVSRKTSQTGAEPASRATPPSHPAKPISRHLQSSAAPRRPRHARRWQARRPARHQRTKRPSRTARTHRRQCAAMRASSAPTFTDRRPQRAERAHPSNRRAGVRQALARRAAAPSGAHATGATGGGALNLQPWPTPDFAKFGPDRARAVVAHPQISVPTSRGTGS